MSNLSPGYHKNVVRTFIQFSHVTLHIKFEAGVMENLDSQKQDSLMLFHRWIKNASSISLTNLKFCDPNLPLN